MVNCMYAYENGNGHIRYSIQMRVYEIGVCCVFSYRSEKMQCVRLGEQMSSETSFNTFNYIDFSCTMFFIYLSDLIRFFFGS